MNLEVRLEGRQSLRKSHRERESLPDRSTNKRKDAPSLELLASDQNTERGKRVFQMEAPIKEKMRRLWNFLRLIRILSGERRKNQLRSEVYVTGCTVEKGQTGKEERCK